MTTKSKTDKAEVVVNRNQVKSLSVKADKLLRGLTNDNNLLNKEMAKFKQRAEKNTEEIKEVRNIISGLTNSALTNSTVSKATEKLVSKSEVQSASKTPPQTKLLVPAKPVQEKVQKSIAVAKTTQEKAQKPTKTESKPAAKPAKAAPKPVVAAKPSETSPKKKVPLKDAVFDFLKKNGPSTRSAIHSGVQSFYGETWSKQSLYKVLENDERLVVTGSGAEAVVALDKKSKVVKDKVVESEESGVENFIEKVSKVQSVSMMQ